MKKIKKILSIVVTVAVFIIILMNIDIQQLGHYLLNINLFFFAVSMLFFIPSTLIGAERWRILIKKDSVISLWGSIKLTMGAGSLNVVTPSKIGDFARAYFMKKQGELGLKRGISVVVFEKSADLITIVLFSMLGLLLLLFIGVVTTLTVSLLVFSFVVLGLAGLAYFIDFRRINLFKKLFSLTVMGRKVGSVFEDAHNYLLTLKKDKKHLWLVILFTLVLWVVEFIQIYFFFTAFDYFPPVELVFALVPISILIGLIPVTVGGMGTRDSALIILFSPYAPAPLMLGVGVMMTLRYWIPAMAGLPFTRYYLSK